MTWRIIGVVEKFSNDGITIVNPPPYQARVLDLGTGAEKTLTQPEDLFCAGHTTLANGTLQEDQLCSIASVPELIVWKASLSWTSKTEQTQKGTPLLLIFYYRHRVSDLLYNI